MRAVPTRFLVASGHGSDEFERVVAASDRFAVVEAFGGAARIAASRAT